MSPEKKGSKKTYAEGYKDGLRRARYFLWCEVGANQFVKEIVPYFDREMGFDGRDHKKLKKGQP